MMFGSDFNLLNRFLGVYVVAISALAIVLHFAA